MDPLGGVSPVMELLRRQMSENLGRLRYAGNFAAGNRPPPNVTGQAVAPSLRQTLSRRIRSLDPDEPQFRDKAAALLVESILVSEFGEGLINDAGFRALIRDVAATLLAEPAVAADFADLLAELRTG